MPSETSKSELPDSAAIALAHLGMLVQIAKGTHRAQSGEIEKRAGAISAFIRTGQLLAADEDRALIGLIKEFISSEASAQIEAVGG